MSDSSPEELQAQLCQRCLMRLETSAGGVDLPRRVRATLAGHEEAERVRVRLTGCLGYCPVGLVSVLLIRPGGDSDVVLLDPARDGAELLAHLPPAPSGTS